MRAVRKRTSRTVLVAVVIGALSAIGGTALYALGDDGPPDGAQDEAPREHMTADEIPPEAVKPRQRGDASVSSFDRFHRLVMSDLTASMRLAPRPADVAELADQATAIARGTITDVRLETETVKLGNLKAARINLVFDMNGAQTVKAASDSSPTRWSEELWMGDPVIADAIAKQFAVELGPGPIGAEVVLFSSFAEPARSAAIPVYDGLVEDDTGTARLGLAAAEALPGLTSVESTLGALSLRPQTG